MPAKFWNRKLVVKFDEHEPRTQRDNLLRITLASVLILVAGATAFFVFRAAAMNNDVSSGVQKSERANSENPANTGANALRNGTPLKPPHIMVFFMENQSYDNVLGNEQLPYINSLANGYELATQSYGIAHPSLPNYLAIVTGRYYLHANNCEPGPGCSFTDPTIADQLDAAGIPWTTFSEEQHGGDCNALKSDEIIPTTPYPWFSNVMAKDCGKILPAAKAIGLMNSAMPPDFIMYTPLECDQGGSEDSCGGTDTPANGDKYLSKELPALMNTNWYKDNGTIILTFDEGLNYDRYIGEFLTGESNHIMTIVVSAALAGSPRINSYVNHFGVLGSIEKAYGLPCLALACSVSSGSLPLK